MADITQFGGATCYNCPPEDMPTLPAGCPEFYSVYPEVKVIFFNCDITPTADWATAADVMTDITTNTEVTAITMRWEGFQAPEYNEVTRATGLPPVQTTFSWTINLHYDFRDAADADITFFRGLKEIARKNRLRLAIVDKNDRLWNFAGANTSIGGTFHNYEIDGLQMTTMPVILGGDTEAYIQPSILTGLYNQIQ